MEPYSEEHGSEETLLHRQAVMNTEADMPQRKQQQNFYFKDYVCSHRHGYVINLMLSY